MLVEYSANIEPVFQTSNFSCAEYNAKIMFVYIIPSNRFLLRCFDSNAMRKKSSAVRQFIMAIFFFFLGGGAYGER